jgi:2,4-dienoyl-CoA reductase-like NADH-dependent reductase (Old Yellow Enzyme family)/thioredoxin reductase
LSLLKSLMRRRQFLVAAGVTSTGALTCNKLAAFGAPSGANAPENIMGAAMAAEKAAAAAAKASFSRCPHLLSPLRIRNVVLKNRIMHTVSPTYFMQGPENFPAEMYRNHYSNVAKNAAIVSMSTHFGTYPKTYVKGQHGPSANFCDDIWQDIPPVENYVQRLMEDIHCEGALILKAGATGGQGMIGMPGGGIVPGEGGARGEAPGGGGDRGAAPGGMPGAEGGDRGAAPGGMPDGAAGGRGGPGGRGPQTQKSMKEIVAEAKGAEDFGYDVYSINTDSLEIVQAVRNATNLILMTQLRSGGGMMMGDGRNTSGVTNSNQPTAAELEQAVEGARKLEGLVDYVQIRIDEHPNAWVQDKGKPKSLAYAEAIKKAGIKILTCPTAGFHYPLENDEFIASGKTDMVGMTTPFFADWELVGKVREGRADDVIPCIACNNCHGISMTKGPWYSTCTVNPKWGLPPYKLAGIIAPKTKKKVAVIGGGPGGMKAALVAAERGHKVTIYEKSDSLGGLLKIADNTQWRWNFKDLKDYFIYQLKKNGVEVKVKTTATPAMIKAAGFDTVLVATGAEPIISKMPGADASNVFDIVSSYSKKDALGKNVVVIGAGKFGTEAGLGMAKDGHKVTVLTSAKELVETENIGPHNMQNQQFIYQSHPDFKYELGVTVKSITGGKVTYTDSKGAEKSVQADSIVIWSGLKPRMDEAEKFFGSAEEVLLLGDCTGKNGSLQKAIRSAFFVASQV